jgi:hypothetical protein
MRETTMMRNSKYIAMALGVAVLLAGCSAKSPTAPKPTPIPAFNISLTPEASSARAGESVRVTAQVTTGSANAPDGTAVTFDVSGGEFPPTGATEAVRTTTGGSTNISVTSSGGTATILGRVPGGSDETSVTFTGVAPTPTPTGTPVPLDYTPVIYALTPNAGPFEGGTRVTISGTGFQAPVQVLFDDIQAQVVSTTYTEVVCISPSITPTQPPPDASKTVQVTVTNINNGKKSDGAAFRYGVGMFISSFTPMEGPADTATTVTIFGQGFVAPVTVVATLGGQWDVLSVAGTEIVARTKPLGDNAHACDGGSTTFTVTNINSNASYTSTQPFTYRGVHPLITSVQIDGGGNLMAQCGGTCLSACGAHTITIRGSGFQSPSTMAVTLLGSSGGTAGPLIPSSGDANTLTVSAVIDLSGFTMATADCSPPVGGKRNVSTAVSVQVTNIRYDCSDTLRGGIVVVPCDTVTCSAGPPPAPTLTSVSPNQGPYNATTPVVINGTNFVNSGLSATFGGTNATLVTFVNSTQLTATAPTGTPGPVTVVVNTGGQSAALAAGFTYNPQLTVTLAGTIASNSVSSSPAGISGCTSSCSAVFSYNASVNLNVTGVTTGVWSVDCSGTGNSTVTMNGNKSCTVTFP